MQVVVKSVDEEALSWESIVSEWLDGEGEIRTEDLDSPYGRQVWDTYHLIGDTLRSEDLAFKPSELFYARVSKAIDAEPTILAPHRHKSSIVRMGLSGIAVAAAVVTVVWVAMPYFSSGEQPAGSQVQIMASASDDAGLRDYVDAHRQFAGVEPVRQVSFDAGASR
ncbi:MAG TPA: sigma-E factor negative regulatory protein [Eoetvoesiella sp.]|uniref:sigma-E factor negative regulatory protein n=1 Tax=Eoetvoesiella sp. TaxID=1966355 RepID=UPI002B5D0ED8|nr:sigma-E factor negative regulatory protein [Eoetvoesiella sp.]HWK62441.1 sigma-E factor negative regulatory protein [Eoetvoesiella sp.]